MNWAGLMVGASLVLVGLATFPLGLPVLVFAAWVACRR